MNIERKKINWKRTFRNNVYMLHIIWVACPGMLVIKFAATICEAVYAFLVDTYLYQYALNALQEGRALKNILLALGGILIFSIIYIFLRDGSWCYFNLNRSKVEAYVHDMLQKKAVEVDLTCFENSTFYDTYVKATQEATERAFTVMNNVLDVIWVIIYVAAVGALIVTIDPIFLVFALLPLICTLLIGKKRNRIQYEFDMQSKEMERQRDYVRRTFYLKDYSKEMRLTQIWKVMGCRMHESVAQMKEIVKKYGYKLMFFEYLLDFVFDVLVYSGSIVLAAWKTLVRKDMLLGDCFVIINSLTSMAGNLNYIGEVIFKLDENSLYIDNLRDFLEYEVRISEDENAPRVPAVETLELKNMSFIYEGQTVPTLKKINLRIHAGERIAIVGHNGAGKTTLIKLLLRLYDPSEGEILVNGEDIKKYRLSSYRNLFGTVFQDYRLFAVSVAQNVMLRGYVSNEDNEKVKRALMQSEIYDKIENLPLKMDTTVTKEFDTQGVVFSGGEAQKISIARIFAGSNEIVIMDEPTSALDPIAEQKMYRNMFDACEGKTVIFISHRLSSATMADRIYLFEHGEIVEQGTHKELLALGEKYADMWRKQADAYIEERTEEVMV